MSSLFSRLKNALFPTKCTGRDIRSRRFVKLRLECLEDRTVLDAMVFIGIGTPTAPALWNVIGNWADLSGGAPHIPNANDDVGILGTAGTVLLTGQNADINSIVTEGGTNLIIDSGIELKINSNPPTNPPAGMPTSPTPGFVRVASACIAAFALCISPALGDPKPLSKEEQAKVDAAIDKGVAFLKKAQTKNGDFGWKMFDDGRYLVGQCALPAYALLESDVPTNDPVIQRAAAFLRQLVVLTDWTYDLSLAVLFFDRLNDPKDKDLIRMCALRLIAGQHRTGGWAYRCPILNDKNAQDLLKSLAELQRRMEKRSTSRGQALQGMEVPIALQGLTVFQSSNRLSWQEPERTPDNYASTVNRVVLEGRTDNSNTQFALLALWAARKHAVPVDPILEISVERFERFHVYPSGIWYYEYDKELSASSRRSMICVGLIALAIGRGLKLETPGRSMRDEKDVHVLRAFRALSTRIGKPVGVTNKQLIMQDTYFLWSLERVAMLYDLPVIRGKDWYRWGMEILVTNQFKAGWVTDPMVGNRAIPSSGSEYKGAVNTSFALLFLKRSHPMKDLTPKLLFKREDVNDGIAKLRPQDKFPVHVPTASGSSKNEDP